MKSAIGSITLDDFSQSVAYRDNFGRRRQEGREEQGTGPKASHRPSHIQPCKLLRLIAAQVL